MKLIKSALLGSTAALATVAVAQAADLPSTKSAPAEYVRVCDAYGAGFFYIPGTQTCIKVGGYVRVDYDYRPARRDTAGLNLDDNKNIATNFTRSGFYNRAAVSLDARTQTAWGTVQTFMRLRQETGNGFLNRSNMAGIQPNDLSAPDFAKSTKFNGSATGSSLEAAYIRFAGFTFGQAAHPFGFMSPWAYNTHNWTGWPNGVRQLAYTATFGGGFSATIALTDSANYSTVTSGLTSPQNLTNNGIVAVGALRMDQAWGSAQVMAAFQQGGNVSGGNTSPAVTGPNSGNDKGGFAVGAGLAINLPMIAAGDRLELTAAYADRLIDLVGSPTLNTPSAPAYGSNPLGGPAFNFAGGKGWQVGAQFRHYWTPSIRSQVYASYMALESGCKLASSITVPGVNPQTCTVLNPKAKGNTYSLGHAAIWSPTAGLDIGLELTYLRSTWNNVAQSNVTGYTASGANLSVNNFLGKVRVERQF